MGSNPGQPHILEEVGEKQRTGGKGRVEERVFRRHNCRLHMLSLYLKTQMKNGQQLYSTRHTGPFRTSLSHMTRVATEGRSRTAAQWISDRLGNPRERLLSLTATPNLRTVALVSCDPCWIQRSASPSAMRCIPPRQNTQAHR